MGIVKPPADPSTTVFAMRPARCLAGLGNLFSGVYLPGGSSKCRNWGPVQTGLLTMRGLFDRESESLRREFFLRFVLDNYDNSPYIYDTMSYRRLNIEG